MTFSCAYHSHINEEVLKQSPHVIARVDLLHLYLCVNVTVVQEVDVGILHLETVINTFIIELMLKIDL